MYFYRVPTQILQRAIQNDQEYSINAERPQTDRSPRGTICANSSCPRLDYTKRHLTNEDQKPRFQRFLHTIQRRTTNQNSAKKTIDGPVLVCEFRNHLISFKASTKTNTKQTNVYKLQEGIKLEVLGNKR